MRLPVVSARDVIRALRKIGYEEDRQKGSHITLRCMHRPYRRVSVPDHREVARGTLRSIIKNTGLTVKQFMDLLE